jgi:hypothetical protein
MARFPIREAEIRALAQSIIAGLTANAAVFPAPPVTPAALQAVLTSYNGLCDQVTAAKAALEQLNQTKDGGQEELVDKMKAVLRYAEMIVNNDDAQLGLLGWGGKATATALVAPGQPGTLTAPNQGENWITLAWEAPTDGGAVASYKIERRERPSGPWTIVGVAMDIETTLPNQEPGKQWEFRVIAANKAGDSAPSNTVPAVL